MMMLHCLNCGVEKCVSNKNRHNCMNVYSELCTQNTVNDNKTQIQTGYYTTMLKSTMFENLTSTKFL